MMNDMNKIKKNDFDDEIDLLKIFNILWGKKFVIVFVTTIFAIASIIFALMLPNIYTSTSLLAPSNKNDSMSSMMSGYSSLAGLAGINLPNSGDSNIEEAIARVKSFEFFSKYFLPNIQLENLVALERWDYKNNKLIYDRKIFNTDTGLWLDLKPSSQEAFKIFEKAMRVEINKENSFVTISVDHKSPYIAKKWVEIIILGINENMRNVDVDIAKNSIDFLNDAQKSTSIKSLEEVISSLLESQMQTLMMATSDKFYILRILDSPIVPEKKSSPARAFICILGTLLGGILSCIFVLINNFRKAN